MSSISPVAFVLENASMVLRAPKIFGETRLLFGDVMILAAMQVPGATHLSDFDRDFEGRAAIHRRAPAE